MRLLRSTTLEFETFVDERLPPYAILSHVWGDEEVSYQEMREGSGSLKAGYQKIKRCGEIALAKGLDYFWADTCCIDKSSSEELSEAINSMYTWYKNASICYAYLFDVSAAESPHPLHLPVSTFESSKWFTRGWTLQELIAPLDLVFLSKEWRPIGEKVTLKENIREITGIQTRALEGVELALFSVAERMSWASKRKTTRVEDRAYSLMGIFGVNMPLLYGERDKSFIRLQEEIMKTSDDQSLFAWADPSAAPETYRGLLASSPEHFAKSGHITSLGNWSRSDAFSMTNKGLRVELFLVPPTIYEKVYRASLECLSGNSLECSPAIYLKILSGGENNWDKWDKWSTMQFARIRGDQLDVLGAAEKTFGEYRIVCVRQNHFLSQQQLLNRNNSQLFQIGSTCDQLLGVYPAKQWNPQTRILSSNSAVGKVGGALFRQVENRYSWYMIIFGISEQGTPWIDILCNLSGNLNQDFDCYRATGEELFQCEKPINKEELTSVICASVCEVEVNGTLVFQVTVQVILELIRSN